MKLIRAAMYTALIFAGGFAAIPTPTGYAHIGDGIILLCAAHLGGWWAILASAVGSTLTDLSAGYAAWAPGTAVIKALTALCAMLLLKHTQGLSKRLSRLISAVAAELVMTAGYFFYEFFVLAYGWAAALNLPLNLLQSAIAVAVFLLGERYLPFDKLYRFSDSVKRR